MCRPPQKLDQKSNDWRSVLFWQNIALNSRKKLFWHTWIMKEVMLLLQKKFGIASGKDIRKRVNAYKAFGDDGLIRSIKNILLIL